MKCLNGVIFEPFNDEKVLPKYKHGGNTRITFFHVLTEQTALISSLCAESPTRDPGRWGEEVGKFLVEGGPRLVFSSRWSYKQRESERLLSYLGVRLRFRAHRRPDFIGRTGTLSFPFSHNDLCD